jgi:8-oxo-dGTP pyrophosphatase MutT (NUDIX family)
MAAPHRDAVRVVLVDGDGRVLLIRGRDPVADRTLWFPPGGGIEAGETPAEAAVREVAEETGLVLAGPGPQRWERHGPMEWRGVHWQQHERWFAVGVPAFAPTDDGLTDAEREEFLEWRWWDVDALRRSPEPTDPPDLARLAAELASAARGASGQR